VAKKQNIIKEYEDDTTQPFEQIAIKTKSSLYYVSEVVAEYMKHPQLFCIESLSYYNIYYLFSFRGEKEITIRDNTIQEHLTQHEYQWLYDNYGFESGYSSG